MSDNPNAGAYQPPPPPPPPQAAAHPPFPFVRLVYAVCYGILAYFVLHILFALAVIQFIMFVVNRGNVNEELKQFSANLVQYLFELVAFIVFARDEQPFPMGPFPHRA
jgi:tellurite resistance protein TehA-like permease